MSMGCIRDSSKPIDYKALSILNAITTSNSNIVFESLMKISSNPSEFLEACNKSKILESIEHIINFKDKINYNSSVITKELLEDYFIDIFSIEQSRFLQNDNIFNNFKYDVDKSFAPSQGLSIIADEDCDSHDEDECWCISDSEIDIEVFDPENTHRLQYNKNEFFHEDGEKFSKSESCTEDREIKNKEAKAYKKGKKQLKEITPRNDKDGKLYGKGKLRSSIIVSKNRMDKNSSVQRKKKSFNLFAGLIRFCCIKK